MLSVTFSKCPKCLDGGQIEAVEVSDTGSGPPASDRLTYEFCRACGWTSPIQVREANEKGLRLFAPKMAN